MILKQRRGQSTNAYHIDCTLLRKIHAAFEELGGATHSTSGGDTVVTLTHLRKEHMK